MVATLLAALSKVTPIEVRDGRDYAEVHFADGKSHATQAMTMNPQDWRDIAAALDAIAKATGSLPQDESAVPAGEAS